MINAIATETPALAPDGAAMYDYVRAHESRARTYADSITVVLERGRLARVYDTEGKEYLDCLSCAGTLALGHNHPAVVQRVQEFLASDHIWQALDVTTPAKARFIEMLMSCLPPALARRARIQFCGPTGADAVEAAVKLFKTATGRRTILAFHGAYHGMTAGTLALTGNLNAKNDVASLMPDVHFLPYPYPYRCPFGLGGLESAATSLEYIERLLGDPESGITKPAAIIVEPIQGEGGVIPAPATWLASLRAITRLHDVPLIVDEVQTGFGRCGDMFAFEASGIEPDALIVSKAVGGGFPLSAVVYDQRYDVWRPGAHAGTFRGNQLAMVAGAATLEVLREEGFVGEVARKGRILRELLDQMAALHPQVGEVRGRGLMLGMELVDPRQGRDRLGSFPPDGELARRVKAACLDNGLILERGGRFGSVLRLLPPLVVSDAELGEIADKLACSLAHALAA